MILKLERDEVPPHVRKLGIFNALLLPCKFTFFTTLVQTDPNSHELLKISPFQRPVFPSGEVLSALQRQLPISPPLENILYKRERPGHVFWDLNSRSTVIKWKRDR